MKNSKPKSNTKFFRFYFLDFILSRKANGFTLIETLVAITILSAAVAGPMTLSIKSIGTASISQDQLVAFYLGQEVIEYVRNVRDTNLISGFAWLSGLENCYKTGSAGCYIDIIKNPVTVADCGTDGCSEKLKFDGINYNYTSSEETVFARTVKINNSIRADGDEAQIDVTVSWTGKYGAKTMKLQDNIYNWKL